MDDELEHSPRSWLDDFTQRFSWCHPSARASLFLNNYFLPGVVLFDRIQAVFTRIYHKAILAFWLTYLMLNIGFMTRHEKHRKKLQPVFCMNRTYFFKAYVYIT